MLDRILEGNETVDFYDRNIYSHCICKTCTLSVLFMYRHQDPSILTVATYIMSTLLLPSPPLPPNPMILASLSV